jgi:hypothetical protein
MPVHEWPMRVRIRVFRVTYCLDLDAAEGNEIRLGVFGDLRMGERYALGLIARSRTDAADLQRVGRLAQSFVATPYKSLRVLYEEIWEDKDPEGAFERTVHHGHSSVAYGAPFLIETPPDEKPLPGLAVESVRAWCMDKLREKLRENFHGWMAGIPEREQVDANQDADWGPGPAARYGGG